MTKNKNSIIGQKNKMRNGMECQVIEDNGYNDITVMFEDGYISAHKTRANFKKGNIANPNNKGVNPNKQIIGQTAEMNCGMHCTVIDDNGAFNITVQFEDGTIIANVSRSQFKRGAIANPSLGKQHSLSKKTSIVGQSKIMNCGMECTVIEDRGYSDIDVRFKLAPFDSSATIFKFFIF